MINYQIVPFNTSLTEDFINFCKESSLEKSQPAAANMWDENWKEKKHTLPYIVLVSNRFEGNKGKFFLLYKNEKIVGCSGIYISQFSNLIALAGVRTWIIQEERHLGLPREYLLPVQKQWALDNNIKIIALSFNEYNKNMIALWKRMRLGENRSPREPKHIFYNGLTELTFPVTIQYTKQWVIYETLDHTWSYDWTSIAHRG